MSVTGRGFGAQLPDPAEWASIAQECADLLLGDPRWTVEGASHHGGKLDKTAYQEDCQRVAAWMRTAHAVAAAAIDIESRGAFGGDGAPAGVAWWSDAEDTCKVTHRDCGRRVKCVGGSHFIVKT